MLVIFFHLYVFLESVLLLCCGPPVKGIGGSCVGTGCGYSGKKHAKKELKNVSLKKVFKRV